MTGSKILATSTTAVGLTSISVEAGMYFVAGFGAGVVVTYYLVRALRQRYAKKKR